MEDNFGQVLGRLPSSLREEILRLRAAGLDLGLGEGIRGEHRVTGVVDLYSQTLPIFLDHGFYHLADPELRQTMAREVTVAMAAKLHGLDEGKLLQKLNEAIGPQGTG